MNRKPYITSLLTIAALLICRASMAQNIGFEQTDYIKIQNITADAQIAPLTPAQKQTVITYIDGFGRQLQTVAVKASPLQNDMIQPVAYDNLGRQTSSYLPYTDENGGAAGSYRSNALTPGAGQAQFFNNTAQYVVAADTAPYSQRVFENSPLQRLLSEGMVGAGFHPGVAGNHYKTVSYRPNGSSDGSILQWNPDGSYTTGTYYAANALSVTDGKDEDGVETLAFTDLEGHTILKRQLLNGANLDTYYIYNNAGMLIYIVPPKATGLLSANGYNLATAPLSNLVFKYVYDTSLGFGRLVQKTVPAKGTMSIIYDPLNRPVLMQDANMAANNNWNYIKYDAKGRVVGQGIYYDAAHTTPTTMQSYVSGLTSTYSSQWYEYRSNGAGGTGYYTNSVFPTTGLTPLAYAYYDDYNMTEGAGPNFIYSPSGLTGEVGATSAQVKGMPTMVTKTTVGAGLSGVWLTKVIFYDHRLNTIQVQSNNQLNYTSATTVTDFATSVPDFTGATQASMVKKVTGSGSAGTTMVQTNFTYDQMYRVSTISKAYNGGTAVQIAAYSYNELGQVIKKNLGNTGPGTIPSSLILNTAVTSNTAVTAASSITLSSGFSCTASGVTFSASISNPFLQTVDYRYNIRGQLLSINNSTLTNDNGVTSSDANDLFGMQFLYDQQDPNLVNTPRYDGKLTAVKWMAKDGVGYQRAFKYSYDQLNRYTGSTYAESAPSAPQYVYQQ